MGDDVFVVEIDGRRVRVDRVKQEVVVLSEDGAVTFRERIQVAAGSAQGLFSAVQDVANLGWGIDAGRQV